MSISARIERVRTEDLIDDPGPTGRRPRRWLSARRQLSGLILALVGLPLLTLLLDAARETVSLESVVLVYLLGVVAAALVGGVAVALLAAAASALLINFFFVEPLHTFDIADGDQALALGVFVVVAAIVSGALELATRRARAAELAAAQAETLSALAGTDLDEAETLKGILERARQTFAMESVVLKERDRATDTWTAVEHAGWAPEGKEAALRFDLPITPRLRLLGRGPALFAEDQRVLGAFAAAAQTAYEGRRLTAQARQARTLEGVDRQRTALLAAVGHDLRTPLAGVKAAVSSLRQADVEWSPEEHAELLATIEHSADRLDSVVSNLLDASRLEAGALVVDARPVALDEIIGAVLLGIPGAAEQVRIDVPDDLPLVNADPGLLERVLANLLDNALRHAADGGPVEVTATAGADSAKLAIVDHGPGVSPAERELMFAQFQRLDDRSTGGVGLGLSVARGFTEAMGGALTADQSYGGGLTMRLRLPLARPTR
jgi:two-component system, OmpR family, sensor histidine kinase KdpD